MSKLQTVHFKNGLTVYLYTDKRRHSTFFQFNTFCGGLSKHFFYDGKEISLPDGVAHILEHYIVECNKEGNFLEKLGQKQMSTNASTSPFATSYYFEAIEDIPYGIQTMLQGIYHVSFTEENLAKIKKPILQEVRGKLDNKFYHANRMRMDQLFHSIDFRDVGGTLEEIQGTTLEELETLYRAFYQPNNQFIVVAGNFDSKEVLSLIEDFYDSISIEKHTVEIIPYQEEKTVAKKKGSFSFPTPLTYAELSFKIDISSYTPSALLDLDFYMHSFYSSSFGTTSPLYQEFVDQKIVFDGIHYGDVKLENYLILSIGAYTSNPKRFREGVLEEIQSLKHLDSDKFLLDQKDSIVNLVLRDESIFHMIIPFIHNIIIYHYPYLDKIEDIEKLNDTDYQKMIRSIDFSHFTYFEILSPKK